MEYLFSLLLCFSFQSVFPSPLSLTSLSPCSVLGLSFTDSPPFSPFCLPPSHHLTNASIFPSFSSLRHPILPPLTPFSPNLLLTFSSFGHSSSICHLSEWPLFAPFPCHSSFLIAVIIPLIPPFSGDPQLFLFFLHSLILCSVALVYLSIHQSIILSIYLYMDIYLPSITPFVSLPSCPQIQSVFFRSPCLLFLSTSLSNSTYLPSLLPFDTLSPCPLIQSSLHYVPSPSSFSSLVHSLYVSPPISTHLLLLLCLSLSIYLNHCVPLVFLM